MEERIFFNKNNVSVSNTRFVVDGQTYAMNTVTSVKSGVIVAKKTCALILGLIGAGTLFTGDMGLVVGVIIIILAVLWGRRYKDEYTVMLSTASGESQALKSKDKAYIDSVIKSLNDAIVSRG